MVRDSVLLGTMVLAFAILVSAHVLLAIGLVRRRPRWHGVAALVVVPLAPWWGWRARMRVRCAVWIVAASAYATSLAMSFTG
jgi:hypothetical protein